MLLGEEKVQTTAAISRDVAVAHELNLRPSAHVMP
jgi:hypothetical protein